MDKLDKLKTDYRASRITRRRFMEGTAALGVAVAAADSFVSEVAAQTPNRGGLFKLGLGGASTSDSLDPATFISTFTQIGLNFGIHNNLTEVNADGDLVPELAESYEGSDDATTWVFKLRQGVEFHNGKTMAPEDVIASINHHRGEDSESAIAALLETVSDVRADGADAVVVELTEGNADFPFLMNDYHLPILPSEDGKIDWQSGIGAGGYTLEHVDHGVLMQLRRNPNYWKGEERAHFAEVELLGIADAFARTNALTSGEIHAMNRVELKTASRLAQQDGIVIEEVTGTQHYTIPMNTTVAPFDDPHVRMALKLAIDRQALVDKVLFGHGRVANDHPIAPSQRFFAEDLEQRAYDPEKAKWHLREAGLDSLAVDLSAADTAFEGAVDAAVLYQEAARAAGIDINVVREPNDGYWTDVWMQKPWSMSYWGGRPTEDWMFTIGYAAGGAWNESFWSNERFMELLVAARAEIDSEKRRAMYREMQELVRDDGGSVIPMYANYVDARSEKVGRPAKIASNWELDGWKLLDRWWMAE